MSVYSLAQSESRFADLIWENEPINSGELVKLCESELGWKKSTTYTVLKKLCDKDIFKNENATVSSVLSRDEFYALQSKRYVEDIFGGSLPRFITAFFGGKKPTQEQMTELMRLIEEHEEG